MFFAKSLDAHNTIIKMLDLPVMTTVQWAIKQRNFPCRAMNRIYSTVKNNLFALNECYDQQLFKPGSIDKIFNLLNQELDFEKTVKKFNNTQQGIIFINALMIEYCRMNLNKEMFEVYDEATLSLYKKGLDTIRALKIENKQEAHCIDLLESLLMQLTGYSELDLLRNIALLEEKNKALAPFLKPKGDYIHEYKVLTNRQNNDELTITAELLKREDIACAISLEEPISCPVYLPNNTHTQCYEFESLNRYMTTEIKKLLVKNKKKLVTHTIQHPILRNSTDRVLPQDMTMAWSHLKIDVQKQCYDKETQCFSLKKLNDMVIMESKRLQAVNDMRGSVLECLPETYSS